MDALSSIDEAERSFLVLDQKQCDPQEFHVEIDESEKLQKIAAGKGFIVSVNSALEYCMFYALSEQLQRVKGIQISHRELRKTLVQFLWDFPKLSDGTPLFKFVHGFSIWADYLKNMEKDGTWGDHLILRAAANCYKTRIRVISSLDNEVNINPNHVTVDITNPLVLGHIHEKHYVSFQPREVREELSADCAKYKELEDQLRKAAEAAESKGMELEEQLQKAARAAKATCKELEDQLRKAAEAAQSNCKEIDDQLRKELLVAEALESKSMELKDQLRKAAEALDTKSKELRDQLWKAAEAAKATSNELEDQLRQDELLELRKVTAEQIVKIKHDVGTCWLDLGIELKIDPESKVRNLERDCHDSSERAHKLLQMWTDQEGSDATVGRLTCALNTIGQKRIAEKLLGQISEVKNAWPQETQLGATPRERNQNCMRCHDLKKELLTIKKEKKEKDTKIKELKEVNARLIIVDPFRVSKPEQRIENLRRITNNNEAETGIPAGRDEDSSQAIEKLTQEKEKLKREREKLKEEMSKYRNRVCRVFLPSGKDFSSSPGVVCALKRDTSATLVAERSSDGPGEASDIFDHSKCKTSGTEEKRHQWWCIDLGKNYLLVITHYALRHGSSDGKSYLKEWQLQGSVDGDTWKNLDTDYKRECPSAPLQFKNPYPYYTGIWTVKGEVKAFRYFRILQTARNSSGKYGIYLSGFELYGVLSKV